MSDKANQVFLIWGGNGWIAGILYDMLRQQGRKVHSTTIRMEDREAVMAELKRVKPTHVLNCAGVTGRPNVDWCEDNKQATVRANLIGTNNLADCCFLQGIHCTIYATGCKCNPWLNAQVKGPVLITPRDAPYCAANVGFLLVTSHACKPGRFCL